MVIVILNVMLEVFLRFLLVAWPHGRVAGVILPGLCRPRVEPCGIDQLQWIVTGVPI